jgi:hypothetical protein
VHVMKCMSYAAGEGAAPVGKWTFHLSKLSYHVKITHGSVLWFDSKLHHHTEGHPGRDPGCAAPGDKDVIGESGSCCMQIEKRCSAVGILTLLSCISLQASPWCSTSKPSASRRRS